MTILESLIQFGFEPVTEWVMKGSKIGPRNFDWKKPQRVAVCVRCRWKSKIYWPNKPGFTKPNERGLGPTGFRCPPRHRRVTAQQLRQLGEVRRRAALVLGTRRFTTFLIEVAEISDCYACRDFCSIGSASFTAMRRASSRARGSAGGTLL